MAQNLTVSVEMPIAAHPIRLPKGVNDRLQELLDRQDRGESLSTAEKREAKGLVELAETLSLLRVRTERATRTNGK